MNNSMRQCTLDTGAERGDLWYLAEELGAAESSSAIVHDKGPDNIQLPGAGIKALPDEWSCRIGTLL